MVAVVLVTICCLGIAFLIRFFIALCQEERPRKPVHVLTPVNWELEVEQCPSVGVLRAVQCLREGSADAGSEGRAQQSLMAAHGDLHTMAELPAERFARTFHHYYEALAPDFSHRSDSPVEDWPDVSLNEHNRMIETARLVLMELGSNRHTDTEVEHYFGNPSGAQRQD